MKKIDKLYNSILPLKVVTFDEIVKQAFRILEGSPTRKRIYSEYVQTLIETGRLERIRRGLYEVIAPIERDAKPLPDKLLIASKIRNEYYLGFHTALEFYGCAYSIFNEAYICIEPKNRFDLFSYKRLTFKPVQIKDATSHVLDKPYGKNFLRLSSKERTFIECVDRPRYVGGWEECVKSLENLSGIDFEKLTSLTLHSESTSLQRRVGYVLELLKSSSPFFEHLSESLLGEIERKVDNRPLYLISGKKGTLNKRWNLVIPENFKEQLRSI